MPQWLSERRETRPPVPRSSAEHVRSSQFACCLDERWKLWRHGHVLQVVAHWRFHVSTNSMHVAHRQPPVPENLRRRLAQPLSKSISSQLEKVLQQKTFQHTLPGYHLLQSAKDHEGCAQKTITDWLSCFSKLWQLDDLTPLTAVWRIRAIRGCFRGVWHLQVLRQSCT